MKTTQLAIRSVVTVVASGLTLLSSSTSEANGRGFSGMRMSGGQRSMNTGVMRQSVMPRTMNRGNAPMNTVSRGNINHGAMNGRDDRGGHRIGAPIYPIGSAT